MVSDECIWWNNECSIDCEYFCMYACMNVCIYVCMFVYMCACMPIRPIWKFARWASIAPLVEWITNFIAFVCLDYVSAPKSNP